MDSAADATAVGSPIAGPKSKKGKKKKGGGRGKLPPSPVKINGIKEVEDEHDTKDSDGEEDEPKTPHTERPHAEGLAPGALSVHDNAKHTALNGESTRAVERGKHQISGGIEIDNSARPLRDSQEHLPQDPSEDIGARLEALVRERAALKDEVTQLRRSLEDIQGKHDEELNGFRDQLEERTGEKEHAETQYRNLLGKVNTIRSQLGERLKADAEDLSLARSRIEELEGQCDDLRGQNEARTAELAALAEEGEQRSKELSSLRNRTTLSQQNWAKEREDLVQREAMAREEFEAAKQAMQDWEILAMEERSIRESTTERVSELEEQISTQREAYEKAAFERDSQSLTVDGLQRALQDIQEARRKELRDLVENSQAQVESLRKQLSDSQQQASEAVHTLGTTRKDLDRALPFEKEVKEKNLLIGKLRHEAVILNDHLTKALRYLKKGKPDDNIDKQLVTNHFLHFLALERGDTKKFQVLQIIAALLGWSDEQREQAGLARPGASNPNLRVPISPWHRTPSTPALSTDFFPESSSNRKESLAELWSDFLEQESQEGTRSPRSPQSTRSPSSSSASKPSGLGISPKT
ncbi:MAG: hypothetical protein Q9220_003964 [cf. Caloplaca sp. 1 TL-2023]